MKNMEKGRGSKNYKEWRKGVLDRDGHKCTKCGNTKYLHCDHIKPWKEFPELRFFIDNGQTLCAGCHLKKGREVKEIINDVHTRFKKGQVSPRKGVKTGKPAWNSGKKGLQVAWNKGKEWPEEVKIKVSQSRKGKCLGNQYAKGTIAWNRGIPQDEKTKEKIRLAQLGKRVSIKTEFKKGSIPWNKGKKGLQVAWNKGIKKQIGQDNANHKRS